MVTAQIMSQIPAITQALGRPWTSWALQRSCCDTSGFSQWELRRFSGGFSRDSRHTVGFCFPKVSWLLVSPMHSKPKLMPFFCKLGPWKISGSMKFFFGVYRIHDWSDLRHSMPMDDDSPKIAGAEESQVYVATPPSLQPDNQLGLWNWSNSPVSWFQCFLLYASNIKKYSEPTRFAKTMLHGLSMTHQKTLNN